MINWESGRDQEVHLLSWNTLITLHLYCIENDPLLKITRIAVYMQPLDHYILFRSSQLYSPIVVDYTFCSYTYLQWNSHRSYDYYPLRLGAHRSYYTHFEKIQYYISLNSLNIYSKTILNHNVLHSHHTDSKWSWDRFGYNSRTPNTRCD